MIFVLGISGILFIASKPTIFPGTAHGNERAVSGKDLLFDQSASGLVAFCSSQWDSVFPFFSKVADNFSLSGDAEIDSVVWWGGYWSMQQNTLVDFRVEFYEESTGLYQPKQNPVYSERVGFIEIDLGGYYRYEATIPPFSAMVDTVYWITFMATIVFPPHWGNNCSWPAHTPGWGDGQECYFKSDMYGFPEWTGATVALGEPYESSFQLFESQAGLSEQEGGKRAGIRLLPGISNPVTGNQLIFLYETAQHGHTRLAIYDSVGKLVTVLVDRIEGRGLKRVFWDGTAQYGHVVANGIYFCRLESGKNSVTQKVVIVR
jgi:hypothetical protein